MKIADIAVPKLCRRAVAIASILATSISVAIAAVEPQRDDLGALEQAFWACDYIGTTEGIGEAPVAFCVEVTSSLKEKRFGGDFDALLVWWRANKTAEHAKLAASDIKAVARRGQPDA